MKIISTLTNRIRLVVSIYPDHAAFLEREAVRRAEAAGRPLSRTGRGAPISAIVREAIELLMEYQQHSEFMAERGRRIMVARQSKGRLTRAARRLARQVAEEGEEAREAVRKVMSTDNEEEEGE